MKVDLTKEECKYLSLAMTEAVAQADADPEQSKETIAIRFAFQSIKVKMDYALSEPKHGD